MSSKDLKKEFYVAYDAGQSIIGGVMLARNAEEIAERIPDLDVLNPQPKVSDMPTEDALHWHLRTYDVDDLEWTLDDFFRAEKTARSAE